MLKLSFWLLLIINGVLLALQQGVFGVQPVPQREPLRLALQLHPEQIRPLPVENPAPVLPVTPAPLPAVSAVTPVPVALPPTPAAVVASPVVPAVIPAVTPAVTPPVAPPAAVPVPLPPAAKTPPSVVAPQASAPAPVLSTACIEIGDFSPVEADKFAARLLTLKPPLVPTRRMVQEISNYMLYIPPQGSQEAAEHKAGELRRLHLDDFQILTEPPALRWSISLGVFKTEQAAKSRIASLIQIGVRSANIMARTASTSKLVLQLPHFEPGSRAGVDSLKKYFPTQEVRDCPARPAVSPA
ncbi:hypothetical protein RGU70_01180 [Herbaspirillum sp. RTI4]|uniref:hypothetical protein n=1 Tax=Herbaspirillum sp. RTI4 TaxID=3048640 RepID=UPI002AB37DCC|nr:hypothetical protein [Herbaspirillum sp. RTI4]MDY7576940.1 hypothetical protein [Herbaspirillum sp. RTI4]MEA9982158.1 hypothetical protein [Herbaspirillum sp. RTI4]